MKKLKLCRECELNETCSEECYDALEFQELDTSSNYMKEGEYVPKGTITTWTNARGVGGISKFK